jgi:anti-sigma B factor antagonist
VEISKILVARGADLGFVKVVGRGSFQNSGCLKAFYQQLLKEGVSRFVVDLDACTYLDSTFLGILLGLGLKLKEAGNGLLHILNASPRNLELLKNLGLDRLIIIDGAGGSSSSTNGNDSGSGKLNGPDHPRSP